MSWCGLRFPLKGPFEVVGHVRGVRLRPEVRREGCSVLFCSCDSDRTRPRRGLHDVSLIHTGICASGVWYPDRCYSVELYTCGGCDLEYWLHV